MKDHRFLNSALEWGDQLHAPATLSPKETAPVSVDLEAGWGPRIGLDTLENKLCHCWESNVHSAVAQTVPYYYTEQITWRLLGGFLIITDVILNLNSKQLL